MSAVLFYLPFGVAAKPTNIGTPGAKLYVFAPSSTTLREVYSTDTLTTPLSNPVIADGAGRWPDIYLDNSLTYKLVATDKDDATIFTKDPYIPGTAPDAGSLEPYVDAAEAAATASAASASDAADSADDAGAYATALGAAVSSGLVFTALNRTALAALATDRPAYLAEAGREGSFVWDSSNLSAKVTADSAQGIYVAPLSDATGATGAWVRQFDGSVNPRWFGISDTATAAANSAAFAAMKAALKARATASSIYESLGTVTFPDDKTYLFASTIDLTDGSLVLNSAGPVTPTTGTELKFPAGVTGIRLQRHDTSGASATTGTGVGADASIIEKLRLTGGYTTTEGEYHGVHIRAHGVKVRDCYISSFQGDGIKIEANSATVGGNANCFEASGNVINYCRNGIYCTGDNVNAGSGRDNDLSANRRWGLWDGSALGNTWHGIAENCGKLANGTYTPCMVSQAGKRYACVAGQEAGASTNAPSGTTSDNAYWYYVEAGAADTSTLNIPAWLSGTTYRAGGAIRTDNNNAATVICGFYTEPGQGPSQLVWPTLVVGGQHGAGVKGVTRLTHDDTGLRADGVFNVITSLNVLGLSSTFGDTGSPTGDQLFQFNSTNSTALYFRSFNPSFQRDGSIHASRSTNGLKMYGFSSLILGTGDVLGGTDTIVATVDATGFKVSGGALGYGTGVGGTVTQATSKSTGVTLNKVSGQVTMNNAALAAAAKVSFVVTNSQVAATDVVIPSVSSGGTANAYRAAVTAVASGSFTVTVENITGGSLSEAPVIGFAVIKAVTS